MKFDVDFDDFCIIIMTILNFKNYRKSIFSSENKLKNRAKDYKNQSQVPLKNG